MAIVAVSKPGCGALHNSSQRWRQGDGLGGVDLLVAHKGRDGWWRASRGRLTARQTTTSCPTHV